MFMHAASPGAFVHRFDIAHFADALHSGFSTLMAHRPTWPSGPAISESYFDKALIDRELRRL
jgi:hypothetical protein